jgi:thiosulfate/3-mercaptopyruvate sulfurtransferase
MLTSAQTLKQNINNPQWVIFDCRHDLIDLAKGERLYREGHIAGAHFAHLDIDLSGEKNGHNGRHPLPSPAAFIAFLARHGVSAESHIVAYDDVGGQFAARLWWMCRWVGLNNVSLLDGGISKWLADGYALSTQVPVPKPVALAGHANPLMLISADELLPLIKDAKANEASLTLIDARAPERFSGDVEPMDPVAGHIPGAKNNFYKNNLQADMTFKPIDELRANFAALTNNADSVVNYAVNYCGSGVTACANVYAMTLAGFKDTKLYAGSWSEWVSDTTRPVVTKIME